MLALADGDAVAHAVVLPLGEDLLFVRTRGLTFVQAHLHENLVRLQLVPDRRVEFVIVVAVHADNEALASRGQQRLERGMHLVDRAVESPRIIGVAGREWRSLKLIESAQRW